MPEFLVQIPRLLGVYAYPLLTVLVGTGIGLWLARLLRQVEERREKRIRNLKEFDAVTTPGHHRAKGQQSRVERRVDHLHRRFSIVRRVVLLTLAGLILGLGLVPFLGHASARVLSLVMAVASVVVGIAAKPMVENLISGVVITLSKLIHIGDTVIVDEQYGTVEDITVTHTIVRIWDWRRYVIPNARMLNKEFINYNLIDDRRWVSIEFWVDYGSDMDLVRQLAEQAPLTSERFLDIDPPRFWVVDMDQAGVKCMVVAWARTPSEGWWLSMDVRNTLIRAFQEQGIRTHCFRVRGTGDQDRDQSTRVPVPELTT